MWYSILSSLHFSTISNVADHVLNKGQGCWQTQLNMASLIFPMPWPVIKRSLLSCISSYLQKYILFLAQWYNATVMNVSMFKLSFDLEEKHIIDNIYVNLIWSLILEQICFLFLKFTATFRISWEKKQNKQKQKL